MQILSDLCFKQVINYNLPFQIHEWEIYENLTLCQSVL
jgi:hypothetical protein